jgi:hypothetical protein
VSVVSVIGRAYLFVSPARGRVTKLFLFSSVTKSKRVAYTTATLTLVL